ncbi:hypothetical protein C8F04DRAFT_1233253 [Mycena alexandri]|uniref:Uncharacterized protein n=1 Tax=Mycena alexandri TaxID=1745969 RepID=A0AAD6T2D9_9AGAR|nr:hypothetical protein C8F04DRAFT_1233253 [Mycena alexandri]
MATELKERERDGKERERRRERDGRERDNDDSRSHRSHRSHREREDHDDGPHRSRRDSHRSRDDADRDRRRHHSHSPPRERRHSTSSRRTEHEHEPSRRSHSRESKRHSHHGHDDHKDDVKAPAYPPDFLRQYSPAGSIGGNDKFDVITGAEAVRFTKQFIRDQAAEGTTLPPALAAALPSTTPPSAPLPLITKSPSATSHKSLTAHNALESRGSKRLHPVVFALPRSATNAAGGAGRKVVDFYMSWRGKTRTSGVWVTARAYPTPVLPPILLPFLAFHVLDLGPALAAGRARYPLFSFLFWDTGPQHERSQHAQNAPAQRPLAARQLSRHGVSTGTGDAGWGVEEGEGGSGRFRAREMGRAQSRRRLQQSCAGNGLRADVVDTWGGGRWTLSSAGDGCCGRDAAASARGQRPARGQGARTQSIRGEGGDGQCRAQEIGRRGGVPSSAPAGREVIVDTRGGALSRRPRALEAAVRRPSLALPSFFTLHLYLYLSLLTNRTLGVVYGSSPGEAQHRFFSYS